MGADPRHKDIFIEVDAMEQHAFPPGAATLMSVAFQVAPVPNPDGTTGIALHLDNGPGSIMDPRTGTTWGALSDADLLRHDDVLGTLTGDDLDWTEFDAIKAAHFSDNRKPAFHYVVSAHDHPAEGTLGESRGAPASDLVLTTNGMCPHCETVDREQAGNLMHELGHNLGLRHGGGDDVNYKPTYLSVMNYSFVYGLLLQDFQTRRLDYDRFGAVTIDERALNETAGFGVDPRSPAAQFSAVFYCGSGGPRLYLLPETPLDFDCDRAIEPLVAADVNRDGQLTRLEPYDDWAGLRFTGGAIGALNAAPLPTTTTSDEPTLQEVLAAEHALKTPPEDPGPSTPPGTPPADPPPAVSGPPSPQGAPTVPSNRFTIARAVRRRRDGSVQITIAVPGPGRIDAAATARGSIRKRRTITVARARASARRAGRVTVTLRPSRAARAMLRRVTRLKASVRVTFRPAGGAPATRTTTVTFRSPRR